MKTIRMRGRVMELLVAALLALATAGVADAATLWAGPLNPTSARLDCIAANVGTKPLDVTIEIFGSVGTSLSVITKNLLPGATTSFGTDSGNPSLCKVTFKGSKKKVRATVCV